MPFTEAELIQIAVDLQARFPHYAEVPSGHTSSAGVGLPAPGVPGLPVKLPQPSLPVVKLPGLP